MKESAEGRLKGENAGMGRERRESQRWAVSFRELVLIGRGIKNARGRQNA